MGIPQWIIIICTAAGIIRGVMCHNKTDWEDLFYLTLSNVILYWGGFYTPCL
jgi:hypothetical protein